MSTSDNIVVDEQAEGIPHPPGTSVRTVSVNHPTTNESHTVYVPVDHDGSRIRVEFPDGNYGWTEGTDPAEAAIGSGAVVGDAEQITSGDSGQSQQGTD